VAQMLGRSAADAVIMAAVDDGTFGRGACACCLVMAGRRLGHVETAAARASMTWMMTWQKCR